MQCWQGGSMQEVEFQEFDPVLLYELLDEGLNVCTTFRMCRIESVEPFSWVSKSAIRSSGGEQVQQPQPWRPVGVTPRICSQNPLRMLSCNLRIFICRPWRDPESSCESISSSNACHMSRPFGKAFGALGPVPPVIDIPVVELEDSEVNPLLHPSVQLMGVQLEVLFGHFLHVLIPTAPSCWYSWTQLTRTRSSPFFHALGRNSCSTVLSDSLEITSVCVSFRPHHDRPVCPDLVCSDHGIT
mmetsp:Transcript_10250/g.23397  ORF Transcript_10250/g.23397 Transcript_10250/m.23397 type:complete len:242 (-) Transcript_10250:1170-1895(-)